MVLAINFWVDIEDASGNKIGAGPLRPFFRIMQWPVRIPPV